MADLKYEMLPYAEYTESDYRQIWHDKYSVKPIKTHDGISVYFYDNNFDHAFYESTGRNVGKKSPLHKDVLSQPRLERMLWIRDTLEDTTAKMVAGYDSKTKSYVRNKRVSIVKGNYVVVIQLYGDMTHAKFITAYVADNSIEKILRRPNWKI